jgi:DNA-binding MarR family transcriptional regulator
MSQARFDRYVVVAQRFGARTVLFQEAAARRLGLSGTQLECFQLVRNEGPLTAADLARETGLTQASLSVIIEKLVGGEFLSREQDPGDRRRWILKACRSAIARVDAIYTAHVIRATALLDEYSDEELDATLRFMGRLAEELKLTAIELSNAPGESN